MDAEKCVPAQDFDVPVLEVESFMWGYGRGFYVRFIIRSACDRRVDGRFAIGGVCNGEVGQSGNADGWRLNEEGGGRCRNRV